MTQPLLSILIATMSGRERKLVRVLRGFERQTAERADVEVLVLPDTREMTIGEKRNRLIQLASGDYVSFVDDDDIVSGDYVASIADVLARERPDVLCFQARVTGYGRGHNKLCRFHPSFQNEELAHEYRRKPNHLMAWRRELAERVAFPEVSFGEDGTWASIMAGLAHRVSVIERPLYTYLFDPRDNAGIQHHAR